MRRRLFTFAAAASLLLFAETCWRYVELFGDIGCTVSKGGPVTRKIWWHASFLEVEETVTSGPSGLPAIIFFEQKREFMGFGWKKNKLGFGTAAGYVESPFGYHQEWWIPTWFLAVTTGFLPLVWIVLYVRQRRAALRGCCHVCHYNLTGNVSGVCPECGTTIHQKISP